jgi:hypothetical protein
MPRTKPNRVVHPAYCPERADSEFFLFGHLKLEMVGFQGSSVEAILSEIRQIPETIPRETLTAVYNQWITRLE